MGAEPIDLETCETVTRKPIIIKPFPLGSNTGCQRKPFIDEAR